LLLRYQIHTAESLFKGISMFETKNKTHFIFNWRLLLYSIIESFDNITVTSKMNKIGKRKFNEIMHLPSLTYVSIKFGPIKSEHEEQNYFHNSRCPTLESVSKYGFVKDPL